MRNKNIGVNNDTAEKIARGFGVDLATFYAGPFTAQRPPALPNVAVQAQPYTEAGGGGSDKVDIVKILRYWIHRHEEDRGQAFSVSDFAESIGMKPTYFSRMRKGKVPHPTTAMIARLARGFGVSINRFISDPNRGRPEIIIPYNQSFAVNNEQTAQTTGTGRQSMEHSDYRTAINTTLDRLAEPELARILGYIEGIAGKREKKYSHL